MRALALLACLWPALLPAEQIVLGLSENEVSITTTFDGSDILIFGAVKRDGPPPPGEPLQVVIAVEGPSTPVTVRRAERRAGIWMNVDAIEVDSAPGFYAVATTVPFAQAMSETEDLRHSVSIGRAIRSVGHDLVGSEAFKEALVRIRTAQGNYAALEGAVDFEQETLFRAAIALPANLTEGRYGIRIYLTRGGEVVDTHDSALMVRKVGLERWLFNLARRQPLVYGMLALGLAILAGWAAEIAFRGGRR